MVKAAAAAAIGRRAQDGVILDLRELDGFTDYFAIFSGASDIQVEGISEAVVEELEQNWQQRPWHREGARKADWILLDYVDFVVHIFLAERRDYYNLERLWAEAERVELPVLERTPLPEPDAYDEDALILGLQEE
ncbi:ribosome silencing factor [Candidatus Poribacteria bacterium]|nr:MAG: ribosome silencing factor [Candidatus Poribacteria bacterium]